MAVRLALALIVALTLGCTPQTIVRTETVEVEVPVPVERKPPEFLLALVSAPVPELVAPSHAAASSALTPQGEVALKKLILSLTERLGQWRAWATTQ